MPAPPGVETTAGIAFTVEPASKHYGEVRALDRIDLDFAAGSTTALIGSGGSGKSTVLRLLLGLGLDPPDSGCIRIDGDRLEPADVLALRRRVGYVIQDGGCSLTSPHLTALGNVALLPQYLGWSRERIRDRAEELAALTHLPPDALDRYPTELSGGQRQRVALIGAGGTTNPSSPASGWTASG